VCRHHLHSFPFKGAHVACSRLLFQHINCGKFQFKFAFCLPWCRLTADTEPRKAQKSPATETGDPYTIGAQDSGLLADPRAYHNPQFPGPSPQDTPTFADPRRLAVALPGFLPFCHPSFLPGQLPCFVSCSFSFICIHMPRAKSRK